MNGAENAHTPFTWTHRLEHVATSAGSFCVCEFYVFVYIHVYSFSELFASKLQIACPFKYLSVS